MRTLLPALLIAVALPSVAQPDTLYVPSHGETLALAVVYPARTDHGDGTLVGHYAFDTALVAVRLGYKAGKPCGVYRAYYPDGSPLIFAVYGFNKLHGDWSEYDEQGRIAVKGQYRDGLRDGTWAFRNEGIVGHYNEGERHGKWRYYVNGRVVRIDQYHRGTLKTSRPVGRR